MSLTRIKGIFLQEWFITRRSLEVFMDTIVFAVIEALAFGYVAKFLISNQNVLAGQFLLAGMIFWEVLRIPQYSISVGALWNIWSRNLSNMFITPMSATEYLVSQMLSGLLKSVIIFFVMSALTLWVFHFNIFALGAANLLLFMLNLIIFGWSIGIFVLGFIFNYGTRIQALAWGMVYLLQPLCAVFFPVKVLPVFVQKIALAFPATYIFEAARQALSGQTQFAWLGIALAENLVYFLIAILFFNWMFKKSKASGQFAKNEQ